MILINGSPKQKKSLTLGIAEAFIEGAGARPAETIDLYSKEIGACRGDMSCWFRTPGHCILQDDARAIYESIRSADVVVWSVPVYVFGFPSQMIRLMERVMPWVKQKLVDDESGRQTHPGLGGVGEPPRHILIMSGALADTEADFKGAVYQFRRMFGEDSVAITCGESNLFFMEKHPRIGALTSEYKETAMQAGCEFASSGEVSEETFAKLNGQMMPKDEYTDLINGRVR
ncbi:MAG: NAD(P)H-dependent oxidoreductase [Anaerovoracaceae bacterium]|nr:NAD(P)H-dependent oxidoreductase [Anaerovoracaceae bacterium]